MLGIILYSPRSSHPRIDSLESSHPRIKALESSHPSIESPWELTS